MASRTGKTTIKNPDDLQRFKSNLHEKTEIDNLKESYKFYYHLRDNSLTNFEDRQQKKDKTPVDENYLQRTMAQILTLETELTNIWTKMEEISKKQALIDDDIIVVPTFGRNTKIDFQGVQGLLSFDPSQATPTLYQVWESICEFTKNCDLTESAMKTIISQKLKNEAFDIYMLYKEYPVADIIKLLKDRFGSFPTLFDYEAQMDSFKRKPGETITTAMARYEMILKNLHRQQPQDEIKRIIERDCKSMVKKIALPEAKLYLEREEHKEKINGRIFSYQQRLNFIILEEQLYNRQKTGNIPAINTVEIRPDLDRYTPDDHQDDQESDSYTLTNTPEDYTPGYVQKPTCHTPDLDGEPEYHTSPDEYQDHPEYSPDNHNYNLNPGHYTPGYYQEPNCHTPDFDQEYNDAQNSKQYTPPILEPIEEQEHTPVEYPTIINNVYITQSTEQDNKDREEDKHEQEEEEDTPIPFMGAMKIRDSEDAFDESNHKLLDEIGKA